MDIHRQRRGLPTTLLAPLLHGLFFVAAAIQTAIVPLLPRLGHAYGVSPSATAVLLAAPGLATLAVSMPAGALADRLGARRMTIAATALMSAAAFGQAVPSFLVILAGRILFGLAFGVLWTTGVAWLSGSHEESGSPRLGAVATSGAVGMVAGPAIGGILADQLGLASPFILLAGCSLALALMLCSQLTPARTVAVTQAMPFREFMRVAPRQRGVAAGAVVLAITGAVGGVTQLLVPEQLHHAGFSASATGGAFSAAAGIYIVVSALVVRLGRRATTLRWAALAALGLALAVAPASLGLGPTALICMLVLSTAPRAVVSTVAYPLATESAARAGLGDGLVIGLLNVTWAIGLVIAPVLAGALAGLAGAPVAYLTAAVPGAGLALWLLAREPRHSHREPVRALAGI